jgi:hypothetical protein
MLPKTHSPPSIALALLIAACGGSGTGETAGGGAAQSTTVTVQPASAFLAPEGKQPFASAVTGATSLAVTWTVLEGSAGGTVAADGVYTAPAAAGTYHVVARSVANGTTGQAPIVVSDPGGTVTFAPPAVASDVDLPNSLRGQYMWEDSPASPPGRVDRDYYKRWLWSEIELSPGSYDWAKIDRYIALARQAGGRFGLRIMSLSVGDTRRAHLYGGAYSALPPDLDSTCNGWSGDDGTGTRYWIPDWNNPTYRTRLAALLTAIGDHYRNDPALAYIDMSGLGNWGEGHMSPFDGTNPYPGPGGQAWITDGNAQELIEAHASAFYNKIVTVQTQPPAAFQYAMKHGTFRFGIRADCFGDVTDWGGDMSTVQNDMTASRAILGAGTSADPFERWKTAPFHVEWCQASPLGSGGTDQARLMSNGVRQVGDWHISMVSSGNWSGYPSVDAGNLSSFNYINAIAGHRLRTSSVTVTASRASVTASIQWTNDGTAPTYLPWTVRFGVTGPASAETTFSTNLRTVLPGTPVTSGGTFSASLIPGTYTAYVRVVDSQGISVPMVLAQTGRDAGGNYVLGTVTVP